MVDSNNEVTLIAGSGGVFEITRNNELMYSKKATHRFPTDEEIDALLSAG